MEQTEFFLHDPVEVISAPDCVVVGSRILYRFYNILFYFLDSTCWKFCRTLVLDNVALSGHALKGIMLNS